LVATRRRWLALPTLAVSVALFASLGMPAAFASTPTPGPTPAPSTDGPSVAVDTDGVATADRNDLLGTGWAKSTDVAYTVMNGSDGLTVLRGDEKKGYAWTAVASIPVPDVETDLWIENHCITATGSYMVVVYGPRSITNDSAQFGGAARAAIVTLATGAVRSLGSGYSMSYFNPGCGAGNNVAITRYADDSSTLVAVVDASTGAVASKVAAAGELTSALPDAKGALYGAASSGIVRLDGKGAEKTVVKTRSVAYDLRLDSAGRLAYVTFQGSTASVQLVDLAAASPKPVTIAQGPMTAMGITSGVGNKLYVLGAAKPSTSPLVSGFTFLPEASPDDDVSSSGGLLVGLVKPVGMLDPEHPTAEDVPASITATPTDTKQPLEFQVDATLDGSQYSVADDAGASSGSVSLESLDIQNLDGTPYESSAVDAPAAASLATGDPNNPVETDRVCSVPRNDPHNQAYQPKPRQVEWAVDMAVLGNLGTSATARPANWRNLGMPAYTPQLLFPRTTLVGGGTIPPQIVLGVLAQESNLWQASRYTTPGESGDPLIGDFYGSRPDVGEPEDSIWDIDYPHADCGYGVGQITDGMRLGDPALTYNSQRAIALDYTANVAMAVRMLGAKWNEVRNAGMQINNGTSSQIENWTFAIWAYNTGFHPAPGPDGRWGVGWANNPVNPIYPITRLPFLDDHPEDAAHPQDWPYQEKVLGFAAHSYTLLERQMASPSTRSYPIDWVVAFRPAWWNGEGDVGDQRRADVKPPITLFCDASNSCDPYTLSCTLPGSPECWFHHSATWKSDCPTQCGYGFDRFSPASTYGTEASSIPSSPSPAQTPSFPPDCAAPPSGVLVVDDIPQSQLPVRTDCSQRPSQGSFQFTFQSPDSNGHYSGKIDLHQLGMGFNGHVYFTHMRTDSTAPNTGNRLKVVGKWSLGSSLNAWTRIWVHLPDHAAWTPQARYTINTGLGTEDRYLSQLTYANKWVSLGVFQVNGVPTVSLSNIAISGHGSDADDVAWDAVGFQPLAAKPTDFVVALGDSFSSGEGADNFTPDSDHDAVDNGQPDHGRQDRCHRSLDAWALKATLPGDTQTIGQKAAAAATSDIDFHFLACSGAETENLLPYYTTGSPKPANSEDTPQTGVGKWGEVSQLDAGYLDSNTTLVTLSIGGNDARFADIVEGCIILSVTTNLIPCKTNAFWDDLSKSYEAHMNYEFANVIPTSIATVLSQIQLKAPHATIMLMGYPKLFESGTECVLIDSINQDWLNGLSDTLGGVLSAAASNANSGAHPVFYVDPQPYFSGKNLCTPAGVSVINGLRFDPTVGDEGSFLMPAPGPNAGAGVSHESVHPTPAGTTLYANALNAALSAHYAP